MSKITGGSIVASMKLSSEAILIEARRVLSEESQALSLAAQTIDQGFADSVNLAHKVLTAGGKIVVIGVGKSGNVAQKLASTLTSTGSLAVYLHPTEALHGDMGLLNSKDIVFLFSNSGSTEEILRLLPTLKSIASSIVGVFGNVNGVLAAQVDIVISAAISKEACPHNLAPTTSSTLQMAIGDALAMCLQKVAGFRPEQYAQLHPGGALGKRLHTKVSDLMHKKDEIALLSPEAKMEDIIVALSDYRLSAICIVDMEGKDRDRLLGIITEGDLRRSLSQQEKFFHLKAKDIMTTNPQTVLPETNASDALELMESRKWQLSFLPVVDGEGNCVGAIRIHDVVLAGLH